jgi:triosephosphate isomerase
VGETLDEREDGQTWQVLEQQIVSGVEGMDHTGMEKVVIAYEPVWAIGTGKTASREQAQEAHYFIRDLVGKLYEKKLAEQIRILYGGSVKPGNVDDLMQMPDVDGALVGGAALQADSFDRIIHFQ